MVRKTVTLLGLLILWAVPVQADVIWPTLYVEMSLLSLPVIIFGLAIEDLFYFYGLELGLKKSAIFSISINAISTLVGIIAIPIGGLIGLAILVAPTLMINNTFIQNHIVDSVVIAIFWTIMYLIVVIITSFIEVYTAKRLFGLANDRQEVRVIVWANIASVGIAFVSIYVFHQTEWRGILG